MKCPLCHQGIKNRSSQQNKALWLWFTQLATALNDAGLEVREVLKPTFHIPWTKESVHEYLWLPIQKSLFKKSSTTELSKLMEIEKIHEVLMRELGERFGLDFIPFPSSNEMDGKIIGKNFTL